MKKEKKARTSYKERREMKGKYDWRQHLKPREEKKSPKSVDLDKVNEYLDKLETAFIQGRILTGEITTQDITYNIDVVKRILNK
jgi:hypothetical protein